MQIEILDVRDPDSSSDIRVWVDGEEVTKAARVEHVDPGAGYELSAWREETDLMRGNPSPFITALVEARDDAESSEYIEDDREYFTLDDLGECLVDALTVHDDAYADPTATVGRAGGTAIIRCEASNGKEIVLADGDPIGPFTHDGLGRVQTFKFTVAVYPSTTAYLDGDVDPIAFEVIDATLADLGETVSRLAYNPGSARD